MEKDGEHSSLNSGLSFNSCVTYNTIELHSHRLNRIPTEDLQCCYSGSRMKMLFFNIILIDVDRRRTKRENVTKTVYTYTTSYFNIFFL